MTLRFTRDEHERIDLGAPQLYREDLEKSAEIVRDECGGKVRIDFHCERGSFGDDPSDFAEYNARDGTSEILERLTISGERHGTKIVVSFSPGGAEVVVTKPDNGARWAACEIQKLCQYQPHGVRWEHSWVRRLAVWVGLLPLLLLQVIVPLFFFFELWVEGSLSGSTIQLMLMTPLGFVLMALMMSPDKMRAPVLVNIPRVERPSWWQRHRRDVTYLLIGWFLGACTSYGVNQLPPLTQLLSGG